MNWSTNVNGGDLGYWFRTQKPRTLHDLDELIQLKHNLGNQLTAEKRAEIEGDVNLFGDAEQFRKYHAVGRFRGILTAGALTTTLFTVLNKGNGVGYMKANAPLTGLFFASQTVVWYMFWTRWAGFSYDKYNEFHYARVHKMLRNAEIKHDN